MHFTYIHTYLLTYLLTYLQSAWEYISTKHDFSVTFCSWVTSSNGSRDGWTAVCDTF